MEGREREKGGGKWGLGKVGTAEIVAPAREVGAGILFVLLVHKGVFPLVGSRDLQPGSFILALLSMESWNGLGWEGP